MKALEMLKAKKSQLLPVVASEKTLLATAEAPPFVVVASVATVATVASDLNNTGIKNYPLEIICYTPLGQPLSVIAQNADHAAFLIAANPKPTPESVRTLIKELEYETHIN